ncbi:MAG: phosphotransferase [Candidatus Nanoarchaeia archaeon]|jgi:Ser/Thr protein kinase RdoA (MazF antagonist)
MSLQFPSDNEIKIILAPLIDNISSISKLEKGTSRNALIIKSGGKKYILKLFDKNHVKSLNRQIKQLRMINKERGVAINPLNGKVLNFNKSVGYLYEYFEGKLYRQARLSNKLRFLGRIAGVFDQQASKVIKSGKSNMFYREVLGNYNDIKGYFSELPNKEAVTNSLSNGFALLNNFKKSKFRTQLVHGDIHADNVLYNNGNYLIIDVDGIRENNLVIEPVTMIRCLLGERDAKNKIKEFLSGYESKVKLSNDEKKAVPYFLVLRMMNEVWWFVYQLKRGLITRKQYNEWIKPCLNRLNSLISNFDKWLNEFKH